MVTGKYLKSSTGSTVLLREECPVTGEAGRQLLGDAGGCALLHPQCRSTSACTNLTAALPGEETWAAGSLWNRVLSTWALSAAPSFTLLACSGVLPSAGLLTHC